MTRGVTFSSSSAFLPSSSVAMDSSSKSSGSKVTLSVSEFFGSFESDFSSFSAVKLWPEFFRWLLRADQSDGGRDSGGNQCGLGRAVVLVTTDFSANDRQRIF
jgi:hypothetical protein